MPTDCPATATGAVSLVFGRYPRKQVYNEYSRESNVYVNISHDRSRGNPGATPGTAGRAPATSRPGRSTVDAGSSPGPRSRQQGVPPTRTETRGGSETVRSGTIGRGPVCNWPKTRGFAVVRLHRRHSPALNPHLAPRTASLGGVPPDLAIEYQQVDYGSRGRQIHENRIYIHATYSKCIRTGRSRGTRDGWPNVFARRGREAGSGRSRITVVRL